MLPGVILLRIIPPIGTVLARFLDGGSGHLVVALPDISTRLNLVGSHLLFSVFAAPIRYLWTLSALAGLAAGAAGLYAV